jgi:hypothetical protein
MLTDAEKEFIAEHRQELKEIAMLPDAEFCRPTIKLVADADVAPVPASEHFTRPIDPAIQRIITGQPATTDAEATAVMLKTMRRR